MSQIEDIIRGHLNELLKRGMALSEARLKICEECPIVKHSNLGLMCDHTKWINKNNEVAFEPKEGYIRGCGCRMSAKATLEQAHCVIGKW